MKATSTTMPSMLAGATPRHPSLRYLIPALLALLFETCSSFAFVVPKTPTALRSNPPRNTTTTIVPPTGSSDTRRKKEKSPLEKLEWKLFRQARQVAKDYDMLQDQDHIMVCVSGGKDSATLLVLLQLLQKHLKPLGVHFQLTAVHVDQQQPGYNGTALVEWLRDDLQVSFRVIQEDTYSIVVEKTKPNNSYCTVCSRLRRGILYSTALELGCNKIALGHHADDSLETLLLNMLHGGVLKAMPARYTSRRGSLAVMRPLITSLEEDIARYAEWKQFPILPCNLCSNQANLQRPQVKLLLSTLESFTPRAKENMLHALTDVRPSHLLDQSLRTAVGMDPITGEEEEEAEELLAP